MVSKRQSFHLKIFFVTSLIFCFLGCETVPGKNTILNLVNLGEKPTPSFSQYKSAEPGIQSIHKVLIIPFTSKNGPEIEGEMVTQTFTVELGKIDLFRIINPTTVPGELAEAGTVFWDTGSIDLDLLLAAQKKYGVDAFIFGDVTHYKPYVPLVLGVRLMMVSGISGEVVWSVDGVFDSDQKDVVNFAKGYYKKFYRKDQSLYGWEKVLISMQRYTRFVANMMVSTLNNKD